MVVYPFSTSLKLAGWNAGSYVALVVSINSIDLGSMICSLDFSKNVRMTALNGNDGLKQRTFFPARSGTRKASASELSKDQPHRCLSKFLPGWLAHLLCLVTNPSYFHQISWTCGVVVLISRDSSQTFALGKKFLCWRKSMTFRKMAQAKVILCDHSCLLVLVRYFCCANIQQVLEMHQLQRCFPVYPLYQL